MPMRLSPALRGHLLRRIELYVVVLAVVFVGGVGVLILTDAPAMLAVPLTALGMGAITSSIQWADRERQKQLRAQAIHEILEMLRDQVLNQLAAMKMWVAENPEPEVIALFCVEIDEAIDGVADLINGLSEEQLNTWKLTYANASVHVKAVEA